MGKGGLVGGLKDSIGNLLGKSDKTKVSAEDKPMKGLGIEHNDENTNKTESGNGKVSGMAEYSASGIVEGEVGIVEYSGSQEYSMQMEYSANTTVTGEYDYSGDQNISNGDIAEYSASGIVEGEVGMAEYSGIQEYQADGEYK